MPIPSQKSQETATPRRPRSATAGRKKNHQPTGVGFSSGSATASVIAAKVGDRRISSGRRSTGLSSTAASASGGKVGLSKDGGIYHPRRVSVKGATDSRQRYGLSAGLVVAAGAGVGVGGNFLKRRAMIFS